MFPAFTFQPHPQRSYNCMPTIMMLFLIYALRRDKILWYALVGTRRIEPLVLFSWI